MRSPRRTTRNQRKRLEKTQRNREKMKRSTLHLPKLELRMTMKLDKLKDRDEGNRGGKNWKSLATLRHQSPMEHIKRVRPLHLMTHMRHAERPAARHGRRG